MPDDAIVWSWIYDARDLIELAAGRRESVPRQFAATLVAAFATNEETLVVHIGDGAAVFGFGDEWVCPSWPENGEYASTTYFVTDDPAPRLTITRMPKAVQSMAVFSDGMERLVLNYVNKCPHIPFFENIFRPIAGSKILGFDKILAVGLSNLLESAAVNDRTDDDKSLILAMRR